MRGIVSFIVSKAGWLVGAALKVGRWAVDKHPIIVCIYLFYSILGGHVLCWSGMQDIAYCNEMAFKCKYPSMEYGRTGIWRLTSWPYNLRYAIWAQIFLLAVIIFMMVTTKTGPVAVMAGIVRRFAAWCWRRVPLCVIIGLANMIILKNYNLYRDTHHKMMCAVLKWVRKTEIDNVFVEILIQFLNKLGSNSTFTVLFPVLAFCHTRMLVGFIFGV